MVRTGRLRTSDRRTRLLGRGAKQRGEQVTDSFTALFTARDGGVPVGCWVQRPNVDRYRPVTGPISCWGAQVSRGHGRDPLERGQFSPVKTQVISNTLEDTRQLT
jgi:hypothetical protein